MWDGICSVSFKNELSHRLKPSAVHFGLNKKRQDKCSVELQFWEGYLFVVQSVLMHHYDGKKIQIVLPSFSIIPMI